jgi:hypothetical protein
MTNASLPICRGKIAKAQLLCLYGIEGLGKTTIAAKFPSPVFLDTERGSEHLDVARFDNTRDWPGITKAVDKLITLPHDYKTVVVDTIDWAEKFMAEDICRRGKKDGIEDFGYGKGYVAMGEEFAKFLRSLNVLCERGMHVVLLGHCTIRKFEAPEAQGGYDRYELKLSKHVAPLIKEWCDLMLFATYYTKVIEGDDKRTRGVGGKERVMYSNHTAAWDAKNRHGLPDKMPFEYSEIAHIFDVPGETPPPKAPEKPASNTPPPPVATVTPAPVSDACGKLEAFFAGKEEAINAFLVKRGEIKAAQTWHHSRPAYLERVLTMPEKAVEKEGK